jgi:Tol biopolymer transport system component
MDAQTGETTTSLTGRVVFGVWSPDSQAIFYGLGTRTILRRDLRTGQDEEVHRWENRDLLRALAISPDGRQLAFVDDPRRLMVISAAGGEPRELFRLGSSEFLSKGPHFPVTWSPDGQYVVFAKNFEKRTDAVRTAKLWRVAVEGGDPRELGLANLQGGVRHPCVHPDGKQIAFTSGQGSFEVWVMENFLP